MTIPSTILANLKVLSEETNESLLNIYINMALTAVLHRMYPFGWDEDDTDFPDQYENIVLELALRYYMKRGAEGENYHSENGVNRTYTNDTDLLSRIVPRGVIM